MKQTIEIEVPEGKKAVWKDGKVVLENIKPPLPKTWDEYCAKHGDMGVIIKASLRTAYVALNKHVFSDYKQVLAHIAQIKLHLLRDEYRNRWKPDWSNLDTYKYCIVGEKTDHSIITCTGITEFLSFQSKELAKEFLNNFRELVEEAGDLI